MTTRALNRRRLLLSGAAVLAGVVVARASNDTVHVSIDKLSFTPAEVKAKVGATIEWVNTDRIAHSVTVKSGWELVIQPGQTATHVVAAGDGVDYYCRFHPNMRGRIVIVA